MAGRRPGDKPLSEPKIVYRRICASLGLNDLIDIGLFKGLLPDTTEPFPQPMLTCQQLDHQEHIWIKFSSNFRYFHYRMCIWKCRLQNFSHFVKISKCCHYNDVTRASWRMKSSATRVFVQQSVRLTLKKHERSASLTLCEGNPLWFPSQRASHCMRKEFPCHDVTMAVGTYRRLWNLGLVEDLFWHAGKIGLGVSQDFTRSSQPFWMTSFGHRKLIKITRARYIWKKTWLTLWSVPSTHPGFLDEFNIFWLYMHLESWFLNLYHLLSREILGEHRRHWVKGQVLVNGDTYIIIS